MLTDCSVAATLPFEGLAAAKDFYGKKLGLPLQAGSAKDGYMRFGAGGGTVIEVFESDSKKSDDTAATFHVADLAREMADLKKRGVTFEEYDLPGVKTVNGVATMGSSRAAWFKDPGGNVIGLFEGHM
jgi:catechol-2,3-dioxygenase